MVNRRKVPEVIKKLLRCGIIMKVLQSNGKIALAMRSGNIIGRHRRRSRPVVHNMIGGMPSGPGLRDG